MDIDWNAELVEQLGWLWKELLRPRLDGLTDAAPRRPPGVPPRTPGPSP
ncbi:MAG: hypothetical protein ACLP52_16065 [Streptosporangiaceae bacterium]